MKMEITNTSVFGFEGAIRGMRNPLASWEKSDSRMPGINSCLNCDYCGSDDCRHGAGIARYCILENDMTLAKKLINAGPEHRKFLRMIHVQADMRFPRYWWSEFDTYHHNTKNSESTMHRLLNTDKPITKDLFMYSKQEEDFICYACCRLELLRQQYKDPETKDKTSLLIRAKRILPEGFLQMRTVDTNYEELRTIYHQRKTHPLKEEWVDTFCKWVESLPYAKEFLIS